VRFTPSQGNARTVGVQMVFKQAESNAKGGR
jgi:hypothetical protein